MSRMPIKITRAKKISNSKIVYLLRRDTLYTNSYARTYIFSYAIVATSPTRHVLRLITRV